eukprot:15364478-Ditylum_brightwellii.AAC.2
MTIANVFLPYSTVTKYRIKIRLQYCAQKQAQMDVALGKEVGYSTTLYNAINAYEPQKIVEYLTKNKVGLHSG